MLCKIAELITEVPEAGGMAPRCQEYLYDGESEADIVIREDTYTSDKYPDYATPDQVARMESGRQFCVHLLYHSGFYLHSSAVVKDGRAFLFSGRSGIGKTTHTQLWLKKFGADAVIINDDKPILRYLDGKWYAYGSPWCGKDGINCNMKVPLAGICFLKQGSENRIRRLSDLEALPKILEQTIWKKLQADRAELLIGHLDKLISNIPVFELENRPEPEAVQLSYETMRRAAEEMGL